MNKTTEALELAEEALETEFYDDVKQQKIAKALAAIREALADHIAASGKVIAEPVKQEPVAWMDTLGELHKHKLQRDWQPVYAAPVRTKDLTDDEIDEIVRDGIVFDCREFARAVITADREKNK